MDKEIKNAFQTFRRTFESRLNYPKKESSEVVKAAQLGLALLEELEVALKKKDAKEVFWITGNVVDLWHTCKYSELIKTGKRQGKSRKTTEGSRIIWKIQAISLRKENPRISNIEMAKRIDSDRVSSIRLQLAEWEKTGLIPAKK